MPPVIELATQSAQFIYPCNKPCKRCPSPQDVKHASTSLQPRAPVLRERGTVSCLGDHPHRRPLESGCQHLPPSANQRDRSSTILAARASAPTVFIYRIHREPLRPCSSPGMPDRDAVDPRYPMRPSPRDAKHVPLCNHVCPSSPIRTWDQGLPLEPPTLPHHFTLLRSAVESVTVGFITAFTAQSALYGIPTLSSETASVDPTGVCNCFAAPFPNIQQPTPRLILTK